MADADDIELTTDEVLRSGAEQLRSSRDVLSMIDDALRKSRQVLHNDPRPDEVRIEGTGGTTGVPDTSSEADASRR